MENDNAVFSILPESAWDKVLDKLDKRNKNMENVFRALPELHQKKTVWLFDQVFPHVYKHLANNKGGSIQCRQVCKQWCNVVDNFTLTHISRRPYNQDGLTRRSLPYREFSYVDLDLIADKKCLRFFAVDELKLFRTEMQNYSGNLFKIGRAVFANANSEEVDEYWNIVLSFLQTFGTSIRDIHMVPSFDLPQMGNGTYKRIMLKMLHCLHLLPNVRSVKLAYGLKSGDSPDPELAAAFPHLRHLETVEVYCGSTHSPDAVSLLNHFDLQIKKLQIPSMALIELEDALLTNMVELQILFPENDWPMLEDIVDLVDISRFKNLKRVKLIHDIFGRQDMYALFAFLGPLKNLEELDLESCLIVINEQSTDDADEYGQIINEKEIPKFPSVKFLKVTDTPNQMLNIVSAFPALEHLTLVECIYLVPEEYTLEWQRERTLANKLRQYIYTGVVPPVINIWSDMPNLNLLTVTDENGRIIKQFARECGNKVFVIN